MVANERRHKARQDDRHKNEFKFGHWYGITLIGWNISFLYSHVRTNGWQKWSMKHTLIRILRRLSPDELEVVTWFVQFSSDWFINKIFLQTAALAVCFRPFAVHIEHSTEHRLKIVWRGYNFCFDFFYEKNANPCVGGGCVAVARATCDPIAVNSLKFEFDFFFVRGKLLRNKKIVFARILFLFLLELNWRGGHWRRTFIELNCVSAETSLIDILSECFRRKSKRHELRIQFNPDDTSTHQPTYNIRWLGSWWRWRWDDVSLCWWECQFMNAPRTSDCTRSLHSFNSSRSAVGAHSIVDLRESTSPSVSHGRWAQPKQITWWKLKAPNIEHRLKIGFHCVCGWFVAKIFVSLSPSSFVFIYISSARPNTISNNFFSFIFILLNFDDFRKRKSDRRREVEREVTKNGIVEKLTMHIMPSFDDRKQL